MKLPENRKKRIQILILIGIGVAVALFGLVQWGVVPLLKSRKETSGKIAKQKKTLESAKKEIDKARGAQEKTEGIRADLRDMDHRYILKAEFGNYLLNVREYLEGIARDAGVKLTDVSRLGELQIPQKRGRKFNHVFDAYVVRVSGKAGYEDLADMFEIIEKDNPFASISGVTISGQSDDLEKHSVGFKVQWPVWKDPGMVAEFAELREGEAAEGKSPVVSASQTAKKKK